MKKSLVIAVLVIIGTLIVPYVNAKNQIGVYLTAQDYKEKKLSYAGGSKIRLNNSVLELPYITVVDSNKTIKLKKSEVFGYAEADSKDFRFYNNTQYRILEAGPITIYVQSEHVAQSKGYKVKQNYYFSTTVSTKLMPLTLNNIRQAYHANTQFIEQVDQYFSNGDVTVFDSVHNMYKLNYLFAKAQNK